VEDTLLSLAHSLARSRRQGKQTRSLDNNKQQQQQQTTKHKIKQLQL
jgi:hypothetical protein